MRSPLALLTLVLSCLALASFAAPNEDIEKRVPSADAPELKVFQSTAKNGLRYTWVVPKGYDGKEARNLTVICHGTGLDYRWGHWNNKPGIFRAHDIVVSVDGPSPAENETRLFLGEKKDAEAMKAFLTEMHATFNVRQVFLYGHSQGGFFVVYYAGEFPDTVAGVVAHASGAWNWSKTDKRVHKVAITFMHGTADPVVPYGQSPGSRDAYRKADFPLLHLRRLQGYNHWPNAVRATECLDWCEGMTTDSPVIAFACAERLAALKDADEYQWSTVPDFSGAREVLRRFETSNSRAFAQQDEATTARSSALVKRIEAEGANHVQALRKVIAKKADLGLAKPEYLGHLVPLREDFRGVDSVEAFVKEFDYDKQLAAQSKAAGEIFDAWYGSKGESKIFEAVVQSIGKAFLVEGYPAELPTKMAAWKKDVAKLGIPPKVAAKYGEFEAWTGGWKTGLKSYEKIWSDWKSP